MAKQTCRSGQTTDPAGSMQWRFAPRCNSIAPTAKWGVLSLYYRHLIESSDNGPASRHSNVDRPVLDAAPGRSWPASDRSPAGTHQARFALPSSIVELDPQIANCAFQLRMPEQQLYRPKILRPAVGQRGSRTAHSVGSICGIVEANRCNPAMHNPGVLPSRQMRRRMQLAGKQEVRRL